MLMAERTCNGVNESGERCRQAPLRDAEFCFWHDPDHATEAAEARRLGGMRRKKERTLQGAYDVEGFEDVEQVRRLVTISVVDALALENSIARSRLLLSAALASAKLLEVGELDERLSALEAAVKPRLQTPFGPKRRWRR